MPDPIRHDDLTEPGNLLHSYRLGLTLAHVVEGEPAVAGLTALCMALLAACEEADVDPDAVMTQIRDAYSSGALNIPEADAEQIELPFTTTH